MQPSLSLIDCTAQEKAYGHLKEEILALRLKPFERLHALDLARKLEMSRTPIREAFGRLEQDELVTRDPSGGFYVRPLTLEEILNVYRVREALEVEAALEALPNIDERTIARLDAILRESEDYLQPNQYSEFISINRRFHAGIIEASGNSFFDRIMSPITDRVRLVGAILMQLHSPRQHEVLAENRAILDAIRTRNPAAVEAAVRAHVRLAREQLVSLLGKDNKRLYLGT